MSSSSDDGFVNETWTYAGRRMGQSGKLLALYLDDAGEEMVYALGKGVTHRVIGATYSVPVKRDGDEVLARIGPATFIEDTDNEQIDVWQAMDRAAYTTDLTNKREAKAKREGADSFGSMTLEDLRKMYLKVPYGQQTALIAQVIRYMQMSRT